MPALIAGNIRGTDVTIILEITGAERVSTLGGYARWRIAAEVIRSFKGGYVPGEALEYFRTTETEFPPPEKGSRHIVSFVLEEGRPVIPDEGYHFPWSPELEEQVAAELARQVTESNQRTFFSSGGNERQVCRYACPVSNRRWFSWTARRW